MDKLASIKKLFVRVGFSGFGARDFVDPDRLPLEYKFLHQHLLPWLYWSIKADCPDFDMDKALAGEDTSVATSIETVKRYITEVARDAVALRRIDPTHPCWHIAFEPSQQSCYFDDLVKALLADNPDWVPDYPDFRTQELLMAKGSM